MDSLIVLESLKIMSTGKVLDLNLLPTKLTYVKIYLVGSAVKLSFQTNVRTMKLNCKKLNILRAGLVSDLKLEAEEIIINPECKILESVRTLQIHPHSCMYSPRLNLIVDSTSFPRLRGLSLSNCRNEDVTFIMKRAPLLQ